MRVVLAVIAVAAFAGVAQARVIESVMSQERVTAFCATKGAFGAACAWKDGGGRDCHIVLPRVERRLLEHYRQHERRHCEDWARRGWTVD